MKEAGPCEAQNKTTDRKAGKVDFVVIFYLFIFCIPAKERICFLIAKLITAR